MVDARTVTMAKSGRWYGTYGTIACPVCQPEARPDQCALSLHDGEIGLLAHCKKAGCSFHDIISALGLEAKEVSVPNSGPVTLWKAVRQAEIEKRAMQARAIWEQAGRIDGTIADTYLRRRGITCALPNTLRFHSRAWHGPTQRCWPALVARLDGADSYSVHRTYLKHDGSDKAPVDPPKSMLGAAKRGAVCLTGKADWLVVAEGIETALSLLSGILDGSPMVWAALSTSGMRSLGLPAEPKRLTIAQDGDLAGRVAAQSLGIRAKSEGWSVDFVDPGEGLDFNDLVRKWRQQ